ncbi:MAG: transposase, partial [Verrucomicrobia bacterium]|nr:transposase [Verrucomicrobiota bacterium]
RGEFGAALSPKSAVHLCAGPNGDRRADRRAAGVDPGAGFPAPTQNEVPQDGLCARQAKPIFRNLGQLIATLRADVLPKSPLGRALSYAENQWPAMARYLEVAPAELDNNSTEHALRGVVLGRRNWLHVGQETGGEKAANLFSLLITCKRLGVEPYAYLHDVLRRLPSHPNKDIWQLTPRGWKETFVPKSPPPSPSRLACQPVRSPRATTRRAAPPTRFRRTVTL